MKREIKHRGLRTDGKGWAYGAFVEAKYESKSYILQFDGIESGETLFEWVEVIPETVGDFTGAKSKTGQDIYESDINQDQSVVVWNNDDCSFCWIHENGGMDGFDSENEWCEIIGNIHEKGGRE